MKNKIPTIGGQVPPYAGRDSSSSIFHPGLEELFEHVERDRPVGQPHVVELSQVELRAELLSVPQIVVLNLDGVVETGCFL